MQKKLTIGQLIFSVFYVLIFPVLLFLISGDWLWVEGWIFVVWFVLTSFIIMTYLYFKDPALLAERFRRQGTGNQPKWDKYLSTAMMIIFFAWMIVMPLDARRFPWSTNFPVLIK